MKKIIRTYYIDRLKEVRQEPKMKLISGFRRLGKYAILDAFVDELNNMKDEIANVVEIDMVKSYNTPLSELKEFIIDCYKVGCGNYLLINEIAKYPHYIKLLNDLFINTKYNIFMTTSRQIEMTDEMRNNIIEIKVLPYSYGEYLAHCEIIKPRFLKYPHVERYLKEGGIPSRYTYHTENASILYIDAIYRLTINKVLQMINSDEINYNFVDQVLKYIMMNIGNKLTVKNIYDYVELASPNKKELLDQTLNALENMYAIYKSNVNESESYYFIVDTSFFSLHHFNIVRNFINQYHEKMNFRIEESGVNYLSVVINNVYTELLRRGYNVHICTRDVDIITFIGIKENEKINISIYKLSNGKIRINEFVNDKEIDLDVNKWFVQTNKAAQTE